MRIVACVLFSLIVAAEYLEHAPGVGRTSGIREEQRVEEILLLVRGLPIADVRLVLRDLSLTS